MSFLFSVVTSILRRRAGRRVAEPQRTSVGLLPPSVNLSDRRCGGGGRRLRVGWSAGNRGAGSGADRLWTQMLIMGREAPRPRQCATGRTVGRSPERCSVHRTLGSGTLNRHRGSTPVSRQSGTARSPARSAGRCDEPVDPCCRVLGPTGGFVADCVWGTGRREISTDPRVGHGKGGPRLAGCAHARCGRLEEVNGCGEGGSTRLRGRRPGNRPGGATTQRCRARSHGQLPDALRGTPDRPPRRGRIAGVGERGPSSRPPTDPHRRVVQ